MRMQCLVAALVLVTAASWTLPALGQGAEKPPVPSIAIIDVDKIMRGSLAVKSARTKIDGIARNLQEQIATEEEALRSEEQKLQQQRSLLTPDVYADRRQGLQERAATLRQRARSLRQTLDRGMAGTMQRIQLVLFDEVSKIAKEIGVNLVLSRSQIVVAFDSFDISEVALKRLNERLKEVEMSLQQEQPGSPAPK